MTRAVILSLVILALGTVAASAETRMWVSADRAERRTCPSTVCGTVGKLYFREAVVLAETRNGWARISKYYDASCEQGRSPYVDSGPAECAPENGIVDGKLAEWVKLELLSTERPDPGAASTGTAALVAQSDDFRHYKTQFVKAAEDLIETGECSAHDFTNMGGWMKSPTKGKGVYFTYCGGMTVRNRIYLDIATGKTFR